VHQGKEPLTNVILVGRLLTNGPSTNLTEGQLTALGTNELFGFGDKNRDITSLFKSQNYYNTMPKAGCVFIPRLNPGDVVHLPLGEADLEVRPGGRLSLYCDQGLFKDRALELTPSMYHGPTRKVLEVVTPGMSREAIVANLGELTPLERDLWLKE